VCVVEIDAFFYLTCSFGTPEKFEEELMSRDHNPISLKLQDKVDPYKWKKTEAGEDFLDPSFPAQDRALFFF